MNITLRREENAREFSDFDPKYQPEDTFWFHLRMLTMQDLLNKKEKFGSEYFRGGRNSADLISNAKF